MDKIKAADMAVFVHMTETLLKEAFETVSGDKYLGSDYFHVLSNEDPHGFVAAPRKALIDLRTMKIVALDVFLGKKYSLEEMIKTCEGL